MISHLCELFLKYLYKIIPIISNNKTLLRGSFLLPTQNNTIHVNNLGNELLYLPSSCEFCWFRGTKYPNNLSIISNNVEIICDYPNILCDNLPKSLHGISFRGDFDKPLDNLPHNLKIIKFLMCESKFSHSLSNLPINLNTIMNYPNVPCDLLPIHLKKITFASEFDQNVDNLPLNIKEIIFNYSFKKSINNLPDSVEKITLCYDSLIITTKLPHKLKYVKVIVGYQTSNRRFREIKRHLSNIFSFDYCGVSAREYPTNLSNGIIHCYDSDAEMILAKNSHRYDNCSEMIFTQK
jgi:hypothetical protein